MWAGDESTVRFLDRGRDWYKANVAWVNESAIDKWFDELDCLDPVTNRPRRNDHVFWQWGITWNDMLKTVEGLGFKLDYFQDYGLFSPKWPLIRNQGFIFVRP